MKITIEPTANFVDAGELAIETLRGLEGKPIVARLWEGRTEAGTRCKVFVSLIAAPAHDDQSELRNELREMLPAPPENRVVSLRQVL